MEFEGIRFLLGSLHILSVSRSVLYLLSHLACLPCTPVKTIIGRSGKNAEASLGDYVLVTSSLYEDRDHTMFQPNEVAPGQWRLNHALFVQGCTANATLGDISLTLGYCLLAGPQCQNQGHRPEDNTCTPRPGREGRRGTMMNDY